ncbi:glycosyltransferase family protein [Leptospira sp. FAT2]|uniref:glycosyltransferase family protein n=1 Tax=Leptospira sanjuanensis TaxID=2879643 RepID=UPI001EE96B25|nr:glycosyltransferase family protein [Leptospira sanjuanensis]MCG6192180.1 glycosyltransferase family protein [Leptospira sanjuanensis]
MSGIRSTRKIYAFIQARTDSTRLPGKVLKEFPPGTGKTLIDRIQERISAVLPEEQIVYLIPDGDEELRSFLQSRNYRFFTGDLYDVRQRYISAAERFQADHILRLTGDNPFYDTLHLDQLLQTFQFSNADLAYINGLPLGMGGEIFSRKALEWTPDVLEERHKEHVSLHIKENPDRFRISKLSSLLTESEKELLPMFRLTIDEPKDFETTALIFDSLNDVNPLFGARECLELYQKNPDIFSGNKDVEQIRFRTPLSSAVETKKIRIGVLAGDPKEFGSGHFERSRILFSLLSAASYETVWLREFPKDDAVDLLVVDSRDIPIPAYSKTRIFLLDHFGSDRGRYRHYEVLPHPSIRESFSLDKILIPPSLINVERKAESYILCYAGNINSPFTRELDSFLLSLISPNDTSAKNRSASISAGQTSSMAATAANPNRLIRIGGTPPLSSEEIEFFPRVSRFRFQNLLAESSGFVGYFGQSLFEAVFLEKKVCCYSISSIHSSLARLCEEKYGIPFAGELGQADFGREKMRSEDQVAMLRSAWYGVSGEGYALLLREIEEFLRS